MPTAEVRMLLKENDIVSTGTKSEIKSRLQDVDKISFFRNINYMSYDDIDK